MYCRSFFTWLFLWSVNPQLYRGDPIQNQNVTITISTIRRMTPRTFNQNHALAMIDQVRYWIREKKYTAAHDLLHRVVNRIHATMDLQEDTRALWQHLAELNFRLKRYPVAEQYCLEILNSNSSNVLRRDESFDLLKTILQLCQVQQLLMKNPSECRDVLRHYESRFEKPDERRAMYLALGASFSKSFEFQHASRMYARILTELDQTQHQGARILYAKALYQDGKIDRAKDVMDTALALQIQCETISTHDEDICAYCDCSFYELVGDLYVILDERRLAAEMYGMYIDRLVDPVKDPNVSSFDVVDKLVLLLTSSRSEEEEDEANAVLLDEHIYAVLAQLQKQQCQAHHELGCAGLSTRLFVLSKVVKMTMSHQRQQYLNTAFKKGRANEDGMQVVAMNYVKSHRCAILDDHLSHKDLFAQYPSPHIPLTFVFPKQLLKFHHTQRQALKIHEAVKWVLKPARGSGGRGIQILQNVSTFLTQHGNNTKSKFILQRYITNPLLVLGKKVDLRVYLVLLTTSTSPPILLRLENGLVRSATAKYEPHRQYENSLMHLTNSEVNVEFGDICQTPIRTVKEFEQSIGMNGTKDSYYFWNQIDRVFVHLFAQVLARMAADQKPTSACEMKIYGADILVDEARKPWLLEINSKPNMYSHCPRDQAIKANLMSFVLQVLQHEHHRQALEAFSTLSNFCAQIYQEQEEVQKCESQFIHLTTTGTDSHISSTKTSSPLLSIPGVESFH